MVRHRTKRLKKQKLRVKKLRVKKLREKKLKEKRLMVKRLNSMIEIRWKKLLKTYTAHNLMVIEIVEWAPVTEELEIQWSSVKICIRSFSYPWSNQSTKSSAKSTKTPILVIV